MLILQTAKQYFESITVSYKIVYFLLIIMICNFDTIIMYKQILLCLPSNYKSLVNIFKGCRYWQSPQILFTNAVVFKPSNSEAVCVR